MLHKSLISNIKGCLALVQWENTREYLRWHSSNIPKSSIYQCICSTSSLPKWWVTLCFTPEQGNPCDSDHGITESFWLENTSKIMFVFSEQLLPGQCRSLVATAPMQQPGLNAWVSKFLKRTILYWEGMWSTSSYAGYQESFFPQRVLGSPGNGHSREAARAPGVLGHHSQRCTGWDCWSVCAGPGVGLDDPRGAPPNQEISQLHVSVCRPLCPPKWYPVIPAVFLCPVGQGQMSDVAFPV